jgi:hypothetical protein
MNSLKRKRKEYDHEEKRLNEFFHHPELLPKE